MRTLRLFLLLLCFVIGWATAVCAAAPVNSGQGDLLFPKPLDQYHDDDVPNLFQKLNARIKADPVNLLGTIIFICAIVHTFLTSRFMHIAHGYQKELKELEDQEKKSEPGIEGRRDFLQFWGQFFHFMGEVEAVFGIWLVPLFVVIVR